MAGGMAACWAKTHPILNKHMLPIGLTLAIIIALGIPQIGIAVGSLRVEGWGIVQTICVVLIFICSGLSLKTDDILKAIRAYRASLIADEDQGSTIDKPVQDPATDRVAPISAHAADRGRLEGTGSPPA